MPIIVYNSINKMDSLERDPYRAFTKKFNALADLENQEIELRIDNAKEGFYKGFFSDEYFMVKPTLKFVFGRAGDEYFVRMVYTFDRNCNNYRYYEQRLKLLKLRVPYFYIPDVSGFEMSTNIDDEFTLIFDVTVPEREKLLQVCHSLINQIITVFWFED